MRAAVENKVRRIVFAASSAVYGDYPPCPKSEDIPEPQSPYDAHKLAGEYLLKTAQESYGIETVSLCYFNVFGPRQESSSAYSGVLSIFVQRSLDQTPSTIHGDGEQSRKFIFVDDIVRFNILAAEAPDAAGHVFNGVCGEGISLNRAWHAMQAAAGAGLDAVHGPARPGDVRHSHADVSAAREVLGFEPEVDFEQGVRRTLGWYAAQQNND
jgi:UDP-glucose 4-epimerase